MEYICRVWGKQIKIIGWFLEMEKKKKSPRRLKFNTVQTVVIGFFGVILGGGILLSLPICNQKPIQFTLLGKIILLLLIQVGGLGVIACMSAFFLLLGKKINMKGRITIQQAYGLDTLSGLVKFVIRILKGTFLVEGIGAVLFSLRFIPEFGFIKASVTQSFILFRHFATRVSIYLEVRALYSIQGRGLLILRQCF